MQLKEILPFLKALPQTQRVLIMDEKMYNRDLSDSRMSHKGISGIFLTDIVEYCIDSSGQVYQDSSEYDLEGPTKKVLAISYDDRCDPQFLTMDEVHKEVSAYNPEIEVYLGYNAPFGFYRELKSFYLTNVETMNSNTYIQTIDSVGKISEDFVITLSNDEWTEETVEFLDRLFK